MRRWLLLLALLPAAWTGAAELGAEAPVILISIDGFRWDYCDLFPAESPTLRTLRREGTSVRGLVPAFPSNTFPNHYTIVTGLYPARHGIVNNDFLDSATGQYFHSNVPATARDPRWWGGDPVWITAVRQGRAAAASFWVGSEAAIGGLRPTYWKTYDYSIPFEQRLDELAGWLRQPAARRPVITAFYLEETNSAGHRWGPATPPVAAAIKLTDARIAALLARLRGDGIEPNLVIVSDHGMTATSIDRTVILDDVLDLRTVQIDSDGSVLALRPQDGDAAALVRKFAGVAHVKAYRAEDLPAQFRLQGNPRIAPVWVLPEEGWHIEPRSSFERLRRRFSELGYLGGDHGYDPALPSMRGILIAHGPAFRRGAVLPAMENIHVYNLLCAVAGLQPATNDGDVRLLKGALRER